MKYLVTGGSGFIGTNLIDRLIQDDHEIVNIDVSPPKLPSHSPFWKNIDILNTEELLHAFEGFQPTHVIHLAARTDTDGAHLNEYLVNTKGTQNVLAAIKATRSVSRVIITSTQFVNQYHGIPKDDFDYAPHTVYGESKVITEQLTRQIGLACVWTLIRPTNIWGPWHIRYPHEFWRILGKGMYFHPGGKKVVRSYGYVKNVVHQIMKILEAEPERVQSKVFYVGDEPIDLLAWVNGFSVAQTGKPVRIVPFFFVRTLALIGDVLSIFHIKFPITGSRYKSMTTSNNAPMEPTIREFGRPPFSLEEGIKDTVNWLRIHYPELVRAS